MSYEEQDQTAEVTEDYQAALDGLTMNSRYEIINLTQIARENTNYAFPISETLQNHIKKAPPHRKLPALYVLDSIVKNIGTPYTLFFGKNLYKTFMESYASVNDQVRMKMAEMLKTWREPVPGSIDRNPVFPTEVTQPIENALIRARNSAMAMEQEQARTQQFMGRRPAAAAAGGSGGYRSTPTPPGFRPGSVSTGPYTQPPYPAPNGYATQAPVQQYPSQSTPAYPSHIHQAYPPQQHSSYSGIPQPTGHVSIDSLQHDIQGLLDSTKDEFARNPLDTSKQARLKALLDLQGLVPSANLPQEQLSMIREQVTALSVNARPQPPPLPLNGNGNGVGPVVATSASATPVPALYGINNGVSALPPPLLPPGGISLDGLLGKGALAALLNRQQSGTPQVAASTPQQQQQQQQQPISALPAALGAVPAIRSPLIHNTTISKTGTPVSSDPMALLSALRGAGMLGAVAASSSSISTPLPLAAISTPPPVSSSLVTGVPTAVGASSTAGAGNGGTTTTTSTGLPLNLASILASAQALAVAKKPTNPVLEGNGIQLTVSSLRQPRPHLLPLMYEALGQPCTQCGRRFRVDDEGKKKKVAHMDWHFRVHQRIAEAEKRGQHRSWYDDEADWISSRETTDLDPSHPDFIAHGNDYSSLSTASHNNASPSKPGPNLDPNSAAALSYSKISWIRAPEAGSTNTVCPIDQEKFETKWLADVQEWVWSDAVLVGGRVYHASCYAEVTKGGGGTGGIGSGGGTGGGGGGYMVGNVKGRGTPEPGGGVLGKRKAEEEEKNLAQILAPFGVYCVTVYTV